MAIPAITTRPYLQVQERKRIRRQDAVISRRQPALRLHGALQPDKAGIGRQRKTNLCYELILCNTKAFRIQKNYNNMPYRYKNTMAE
jgi:hypothetical protein